ncbi:putative MFS family arabinose efflux permease [Actinocorallia herbida]|uniref:Putative MFS family arabinose efflux permease n=1 Tax=Actinocorallia herbida TaxID=58109 RepID=A0A3N1CZR7_9ACTN|nr:MFS transporter [Actinocorallia herbida]ROO86736.1 putative MFS family arabinose efflux permease [Actinocorallia herbida]
MISSPGSASAAADARVPGAHRVLALLTLANFMNFYDRTVPAIVVEPIKAEFGLGDGHIGAVTSAFTVVYALAGIALGRVADRGSRRRVMAGGLVVWSLFTAVSGGAWSFAALLLFRLGVGIGEASYAPAANAMIFDVFPPGRRARAIGVFQLGIPVGLLAAFLSVGWIVEATGSWRVPFLLAAVPGFVLAALMLTLPEPRRDAAGRAAAPPLRQAVRSILAIPTVRRLVLAGVGVQIPAHSMTTFLVPYLQRHFGLGIGAAAQSAGLVLGLTGIAGLLLGGVAADRAGRRSLPARMTAGAAGVALSAPLTLAALLADATAVTAFLTLFAAGWLFHYFFITTALPAIADVVEPHLRATAVAVYYASFYLLGGAFGPIVTGALSDRFTAIVPAASAAAADAAGLHYALLVVVPVFLLLGALALWTAGRTITTDHTRMLARTTVSDRPARDVAGRGEAELDRPAPGPPVSG